jgi:hypothetical protein
MKEPIAKVESPALNAQRNGRGFSREELKAAKISIDEAREAGLIVDLRRRSKYKDNVDSLKSFKVDYAKYLEEKEKERIKAQKLNKKARKEAIKRKKELDAELSKREKEIEEEKKKVQEEIARREAEELALESEIDELSEDELAELDELEAAMDEPAEVSPEEELEKLEDDLAESLGITEAKEEEPEPDGTKRTVKRVRKKPSTTTKGATEEAEKKE